MAQIDPATPPEEEIVSRVGLVRHLAQLGDRRSHVAIHHARRAETPAAFTGMQTGADGVGQVAPFLASRSCRAGIACDMGRERLPGEDLARRNPSPSARAISIASAKSGRAPSTS